MNTQDIINRFIELCRIPSPSLGERHTADYCSAILKRMGAEVREDGAGERVGGSAGNIVARFQGRKNGIPPLMLNAHMDTVDPGGAIVPVIRDGRIISEGSTILGADNRAGLTMIIEGMKRVLDSGIATGDIEVVLTIGEEMGLEGAAHLDYSMISAKHGYSLDSSGLGRIVQGAPFYNAIDVSIQGRRAHAAVNADQGINSIEVMARGLSRLVFGRLDHESTANIGKIAGGTARNVVPSDCTAVLEMRSHNAAKLDFYTANVTKVFLDETRGWCVEVEGREFRPVVDVAVHRECHGFLLDPESPVIQCAMKALELTGRNPDLYRNMGGSDANVFNFRGIETAVVGTGQTAVHSAEEYIEIEDLTDGVRLVPTIIQQWIDWWS
ncbi:MAG TPA: M20/M25/M40 family metallo-hydrolase [bacterium]|nr:M20/M25/M40 family metallo-hydrolase [bacterium]